MQKYLPYMASPMLLSLSLTTYITGGSWMWTGFLIVLISGTIGDSILPRHRNQDSFEKKWLLNSFLYIYLYHFFGLMVLSTLGT